MEYTPIDEPADGADDTAPRRVVTRRGGGPRRRPAPLPKPRSKRPVKRKRTWWSRLWISAWVWVTLLGAGAGVVVAHVIHMPEVDELVDYAPGLVTHLFDRYGEPYRTYAVENRELIEAGGLPEILQNAIIAVEDERFLQHGGIDLRGVMRAARSNLEAGAITQGASTLTMQLAENLFHTRGRDWKQKISEALLAVEIEKRYSKQQIITMYSNIVYMGEGNYGMQAAAKAFFNKPVEELSLVEAATLAGIPQRPNGYSPYRHPDALVKRRNHVLGRMLEVGFIDDEAHAAAIAEPLLVAKRRLRTSNDESASYFSEEVRQGIESSYGSKRLYGAGLRVHTTLDQGVQRASERALRQQLLELDHRKGWRGPIMHLDGDPETTALPSWQDVELTDGSWYEGVVVEVRPSRAVIRIAGERFELGTEGVEWARKRSIAELLKVGDVAWFRLERPEAEEGEETAGAEGEPSEWEIHLEQEPELEAGAVVLESATGAVRAMVGGWDFERSKFNRVTQAQRQVGSGFKPFVYGAALESGFTPADTLFDSPVAFLGADNTASYSPRNFHRRYWGIITLQKALQSSINVTAVKLLDLVGVERVIDFARRCGIDSELPPYPSLALGSADVVPLEIAAAYATFANHGIHVRPYWIESVTTPDGRLLEEHLPQAHKAMEPQVAYVLSHMLEGVVDRGTGASLARYDLDLAGKTGTTNDYADAWFIGFTPKHTLLVWVGYDVRRSIGRGMTGAAAALPIWRGILEAGLEAGWIETGIRFAVPPGVELVEIEPASGRLPPPGGGVHTVTHAFIAGTQPTRAYDREWGEILSLPWYQQRAFYIPKAGERMPDQVPAEQWAEIR